MQNTAPGGWTHSLWRSLVAPCRRPALEEVLAGSAPPGGCEAAVHAYLQLPRNAGRPWCLSLTHPTLLSLSLSVSPSSWDILLSVLSVSVFSFLFSLFFFKSMSAKVGCGVGREKGGAEGEEENVKQGSHPVQNRTWGSNSWP